jgi:hypothetical protein
VRHELFERRALLGVEALPDLVLAELGGQSLEAPQRLLDLHGVVGEKLGRGVYRRQPAADDDRRQPHL